MSNPIFRTLQEKLDQYSMGFPKTESGIEIKILEKLFSIDDAKMFLQLSPMLETPDKVSLRVEKSPEETSGILADMAHRGLLFSLKKGDTIRYGAIPFVHGLFEFQINKMDRELAAMVRQYMDEEFKDALSFSLSNFLAQLVFSNHYAQVDEALCTGCETCLERCQMDAIFLTEEVHAVVNRDRCIGCGLCVTTCPTEAILLEQKDEQTYQVPPKTSFEQMMTMAQKRGVI